MPQIRVADAHDQEQRKGNQEDCLAGDQYWCAQLNHMPQLGPITHPEDDAGDQQDEDDAPNLQG